MKLAGLFADHAVLQRGIPITVWGWMTPRSKVVVKLGAIVVESLSGADGKFLVRFPPMTAGGPYILEALDKTTGNKATAHDIMIGEVWVASGQSNMEWTLAMSGETDAAKLHIPGVRMFTVPQLALAGRQTDITAAWQLAESADVVNFSAVAYYYARKLYNKLGVVIGIINSSWGGTFIEAWTSRETLLKNPDIRHWMESYEANLFSPDFWADYADMDLYDPSLRSTVQTKNRFKVDPGITAESKSWARPEFIDSSWPEMDLPGSWKFNGVKTNGVIWFRREIELPPTWLGEDLIVNIGAVDKQDITFFNGEKIGATGTGYEVQHWDTVREYKIPAKLVKSGKNIIAIRAYSFIYDGGLIGPASKMTIAPANGKSEPIPLHGKWRYQIEHDFGDISSDPMPMGPGVQNSPYILFDNMIAPLIPYSIRGIIWYQGESNENNAEQYCRMMMELIQDWRHFWGQGNFPFLLVQLANYRTPMSFQRESSWSIIREAQLQTLREVPNTGMTVTIDIGEAKNIHPKNKKDVGDRLARWTLFNNYGHNIVPSGPVYQHLTIERTKIRLYFDFVGSGLVVKGEKLRTFVIAGKNREFNEAKAIIDGDTVLVWSDNVSDPVAVRYAWADNPAECNLYNANGLPASPFRTDTWSY